MVILFINTGHADQKIEIKLKKGRFLISKKIFSARRSQAEKLLPAIDKLLKSSKITLRELGAVVVENKGGSFTGLRIGVASANALAYALGIPVLEAGNNKLPSILEAKNRRKKFNVIRPIYSSDPNITV